jgi:hypothetical protein
VAATPVAHVNDQVIAVLLEPVTRPLKSCVRLVMTLAWVGEMVMATVEVALDPQPIVPATAARTKSADNFHHLIPILPRFPDFHSRYAGNSSRPTERFERAFQFRRTY